MNPLGPHFYVDVEEGQKPTGMVDLLTDRMNVMLGEVNGDHGWPITHAHIKGHTAITPVSWEPNDDKSYGIDLNLECPAVSLDWYSREELHDWPEP